MLQEILNLKIPPPNLDLLTVTYSGYLCRRQICPVQKFVGGFDLLYIVMVPFC